MFNAFFGRCSVSFGLLSIDRSGARVHTRSPIAGDETEIYSTNPHFMFCCGNSDGTDGLDDKIAISMKMPSTLFLISVIDGCC